MLSISSGVKKKAALLYGQPNLVTSKISGCAQEKVASGDQIELLKPTYFFNFAAICLMQVKRHSACKSFRFMRQNSNPVTVGVKQKSKRGK